MSHQRNAIVTLAESAQAVLDRWAVGDLAEAVRHLDQALAEYRQGHPGPIPQPPQHRDQGGSRERV